MSSAPLPPPKDATATSSVGDTTAIQQQQQHPLTSTASSSSSSYSAKSPSASAAPPPPQQQQQLLSPDHVNGILSLSRSKVGAKARKWAQSKKKHSYKSRSTMSHRKLKDILRWRASVLPSVIIPTIALTVWSTIVCIFFMVKDLRPILGRTSSLGITLTQIRNLARLVWITSPPKRKDAIQKRGAMNLIIAFGCSIKHYLRMEPGYNYDDLGPFLAHLPEYGTSDATSPTTTMDHHASMKNLPLDITFHLQAYVTRCRRTEQIDIPTQGAMTTALSTLVDCLSGFERIRDSPIPLAYSIHLKQTLLLYLLSLPFQLVPGIFWGTIPAVTIAAFTLLGIEAIGGQIENPFGYDENDLPQDEYTEGIREEVFGLMAHCETEQGLVDKYDAGRWLEPFKDISITDLHQGAEKERTTVVEVANTVMADAAAQRGVGWGVKLIEEVVG
ncbi:Bestrophin, RFP-TM, chloride channel-domain-containing protein [Chytridium lagenaria]|nr:Bestrophin, RFP-TM, chloride channel-domain-containing protein [Chytridium lagenaria]